uniref:Nuclear egress lamina protein n=1 Tax=Lemniscomys rat herpesvirus TaxID=3141920 RepID=A0AAU7E1X7_9VIRU
MMKLPITGKESICLPFNFNSHRQHTCLDLSPYGNEQVSKSACTTCRQNTTSPTASDSMVAFINQVSNVMKNRKFYYGFRKDMDLLKMSANQPQLFQIYYIVNASISDIIPILYSDKQKLHMQLVFENPDVHLPCDCIDQVLAVSRESYSVVLDIIRQHLVLTVTCLKTEITTVRIDVMILQRKVDEMEIPNDVNEQFERYTLHDT